jgi:predicted nucleotidyltransferase
MRQRARRWQRRETMMEPAAGAPGPDARRSSLEERETGPTPYTDLNDVLAELSQGIRGALGEDLVGFYLQGSLATGGFDGDSDVDFIVVTRDELVSGQVDTLQGVHGRVFDLESDWAKHLEGSYFPQEVVRDSERAEEELWYLEHGDRALKRSSHCNTVVVRWVVREHGVALVGPDPSTLINTVTMDMLRDDIAATIRDWGAEILADPDRFRNRFYQSFIVLSYCRMLHDLETGRIGSKREGTEWAKRFLDSSWVDLIDRAWNGRPDAAWSVRQPPDEDDFVRTLEFVRFARYAVGDRKFRAVGRR